MRNFIDYNKNEVLIKELCICTSGLANALSFVPLGLV